MIFVSTGTVGFEPLVRLLDDLCMNGRIRHRVVAQIGSIKYEPGGFEYFRFDAEIRRWIREADLVISHGGQGTIRDVLAERTRLVAVPNPIVADNHQYWFLRKLESLGQLHLCCGLDADELLRVTQEALAGPPPESTYDFYPDSFRQAVKRSLK